MSITVLDSTDLTGILADAGVELEQPEPKPADKPVDTPVDKVTEPQDDPDDIEGDDGLTPRQKRELTATMQKAIGKKHRMLKEAEEFAAAQYSERKLAEQRAEQHARELAELKAKLTPAPEKPAAPEAPQRQNFANESDYVDAMIQWGVDKRLAEKAEEDRQARAKREYQERIDAAAERIKSAFKLVPDFEEVVGNSDLQLPQVIGTYLEESEMVAELSYYLAKNPDILVSLEKLSPHAQLVKIGKIESSLSPFEPRKEAPHDEKSSDATSNGKAAKAAPSTETDTGIDLSKPRSKPAPVFSPLDATGSAGHSKDPEHMNTREMIEDFAKRNKVNLNARKRH